MPNIASVLKQEIVRLARKEVRTELRGSQQAIASYRHQISDLKRRLSALEREATRVSAQRASSTPAEPEVDDGNDVNHRWRAAGFAQHRKRLGLSATDCGKLLGVSALTVYKWEGGQARPRARYLPAIAALRGMGKREAAKRLAEV